MKEKLGKRYFALYFFTSMICFSAIYLPIILQGKMYLYLDIGADTYCSYWPSLSYVSELIRNPCLWDMKLGLGGSTIIQFSWFALDPFNWVIFLFPEYNMDIGIFISLFLKYVVLTIGAYLYLSRLRIEKIAGVMASLCIVFSGWFICWGQHYYFATSFVLFIWLIYHFERWIQSKKWLRFVLNLSLLSVINIYFCYMSLVFLAIYYLFRYFTLKGEQFEWNRFIIFSLQTIALCLSGILLAAISFFPALIDILSSPRVGNAIWDDMFSFGNILEYISIIMRMLGNGILGINHNFIGYKNFYESPFIFTSILAFYALSVVIKKEKRVLPIVILISLSLLFSHISGSIFNAFSTITYRWTFVLIPVMALLIGKGITALQQEQDKVNYIIYTYIAIISIVIFFCIYLFTKVKGTFDQITIISIFLIYFFATLYLILIYNYRKNKKFFVSSIYIAIVSELIISGSICVQMRTLIPRSSKNAMNYFDSSGELLDYIKKSDDTFYRINKKYGLIDLNDSMMRNYPGEKYYSSTLTKSYWDLQNIFDLRIKNSNYFYGFDDKQALRDINCGKYMISNEDRQYYGYRKIRKSNSRYLYENINCLDFGIAYDFYISEHEFENFNEYEKQQILYQTCVVSDEDICKIDSNMLEKKTFEFDKLTLYGYDFEMDSSGYTLTLHKPNEAPLLFEIVGADKSGTSGSIITSVKEQDDFNYEEAINIVVPSNETKLYNIDTLSIKKIRININPDEIVSIQLYKRDPEVTQSIIEERKKSKQVNLREWNNEKIICDVSVTDNALLYMPIIYDKRWKIYVNEQEVSAIKTNGGFTSIYLSAGNYNIRMEYSRKLNYICAIISSTTALIITVFFLKEKVHHMK